MKRLIKNNMLITGIVVGLIHFSSLMLRTPIISMDAIGILPLPWEVFQIRDDSVEGQDISGSYFVWFKYAELELLDLVTGETTSLDNFMGCSDASAPEQVKIEGDWLATSFKCYAINEVRYQTHVINVVTAETFLLEPNQPDPTQPYSWYPDINQGRVVWVQMGECTIGDVFMMDLTTREVTNITTGTTPTIKINVQLGGNWVVWDAIDQTTGDIVLYLHNLIEGSFTTIHEGERAHWPVFAGDKLFWAEYDANSQQTTIWSYDLVTQEMMPFAPTTAQHFLFDANGRWLLYAEGRHPHPAPPPLDIPTSLISGWPCQSSRSAYGLDTILAYDLLTGHSYTVYENPQALDLYHVRIDDNTAVWFEWGGPLSNDTRRVYGSHLILQQQFLPLIRHRGAKP